MIDVPIIDAHHHLCRLADGYPWLSGRPQRRYHGDDTVLRHDYLPADYIHDFEGLPLVASVCIENGAADAVREAEWIDSLCDATPVVQVAKADLSDPAAPGRLDRYLGIASVRGVRDILNWHPDPFYTHRDRADLINDPTWRANFAKLGDLGLSFDLQVFSAQLPAAAALAAAHPSVLLVLDHLGMPIGRDPGALAAWEQGLGLLARQDNVKVKISAIGTTDHAWTVESIRPLVLTTIEKFGVDRCMFASNFPVDGMYSTLRDLYGAFDELTADFSRAERARLFGGTAAETYRIDTARWKEFHVRPASGARAKEETCGYFER